MEITYHMSPKGRLSPSRVPDRDANSGSGEGESESESESESERAGEITPPTSSSANDPTSTRRPPCVDGDSRHGFAVTCQHLRPVVHVKVGYPLLCYLNDRDWRNVFPEFEECGGGLKVGFENADALLQEALAEWVDHSVAWLESENVSAEAATVEEKDVQEAKANQGTTRTFHEKDLSKELADRMRNALSPAAKCWSVKSEPHLNGSVDVRVNDDSGSPVLMLEAGLSSDDWWTKADQGLMNVKGLHSFNKPLLFVVLTLDRVKEVSVIEKDRQRIVGGRIGTFLVTPRSENGGEFRLSLLSRAETTRLSELSAHLGRVLRAACLLPKWNATESNYRYIGPSCCRIMNDDECASHLPRSEKEPQKMSRVLRVYDNRLRHTDRRPDLYLAEDLHEGGKKVCEVFDTEDPAEALPFGSRIEAESDSGSATTTITTESGSRDWLWGKKGQFLAITVPFRDGRHYAINIKDFKPILTHLRKLHENDYVHGDIRGFNMVMHDENEGYLIDLDYGGSVQGDVGNVPRYPKGYMFSLPDGARPRRSDRSPISMKDDLQAMANLMFDLHYADDISPMDSVIKARKWQRDLRWRISKLVDEDGQTVLDLLDELLKFADNAKWNVAPTEDFRYALESFGYDLENSEELATSTQDTGGTGGDELGKQRRVGTDPATGSPSKRTMM